MVQGRGWSKDTEKAEHDEGRGLNRGVFLPRTQNDFLLRLHSIGIALGGEPTLRWAG
jgi:hypothetical protein